MLGDATCFCLSADHETSDVLKENKRNSALATQFYEMGSLTEKKESNVNKIKTIEFASILSLKIQQRELRCLQLYRQDNRGCEQTR